MVDTYIPTDDGYWVNERFMRIAEVIKDFDPTLELAWIPTERRALYSSPPYAVVHKPEGLKSYIVFYIEEDNLDERVLARIFRGDLTKLNPLQKQEALEAAREAMRLKELQDRADERQDLVASIVGSSKHSFKHNGVVFRK